MNLADGVQLVSFGILAGMMISAAIGVVLLESIVYSAFLLGGVFISIAGLYILLNADFVAAAQVLIYVGAINVLILFAIMLVNKKEDFAPIPGRWIRKAATGLVCLGLLALLGTMILSTPWTISTVAVTLPLEDTVVRIGKHLFSDFLLPFELASVLLLMAMIGAIILARRDFIPEEAVRQVQQSGVYTLPERPRELISTGSSADKSE